jgi:nucleoside triphosphate diphosphatase
MVAGQGRPSENPIQESWRIQCAASAMGFDWPDVHGVLEKVREELGEIEAEVAAGDREAAKRELGDVLFALVNVGRFLEADLGEALHGTNQRFTRRFELLKTRVTESGRRVEDCTLAELDAVWMDVKSELARCDAGENDQKA